jgi:hypothetical protein
MLMRAGVDIGARRRGPAASAKGEAIRAVVHAYQARMAELLARLPHDLPHREERAATPDEAAASSAPGPGKPPLVRAFAPMGYDCRGETGTFTLRRRTLGNLTVKLKLDVGTWAHSVMAFVQVEGMIGGEGFKATPGLPVSPSAARAAVNGVEQSPGGPGCLLLRCAGRA